jgi:RNA recognition motif-containing protein
MILKFRRYDDPATALSAMRSLNGYELNGRKIRVDFTNTSNLKEVARALGHEVPEVAGAFIPDSFESSESSSMGLSVKDVISRLKLHDAYDLLAAMKAYIDGKKAILADSNIYEFVIDSFFAFDIEDRGVRAKVLFKEFPQLTTAFSEIQLRLGMGLGVTAADLNLPTTGDAT